MVSDTEAARGALIARGAEVSEAFHFTEFGAPRVAGPDPRGRSYGTYASFSDPDGNGWLLREIRTRLPGRGLGNVDVATLTELLREAETHHGDFVPNAPKHQWSEWCAACVEARERGRTPEEAAGAGGIRVEGVRR